MQTHRHIFNVDGVRCPRQNSLKLACEDLADDGFESHGQRVSPMRGGTDIGETI